MTTVAYKKYKRVPVRFNAATGQWEQRQGRKWIVPKARRSYVTVVAFLVSGKQLRKRVGSGSWSAPVAGIVKNFKPIEFAAPKDQELVGGLGILKGGKTLFYSAPVRAIRLGPGIVLRIEAGKLSIGEP